MLGLGWFRMKEQISAFSEFCNVGDGLSTPCLFQILNLKSEPGHGRQPGSDLEEFRVWQTLEGWWKAED